MKRSIWWAIVIMASAIGAGLVTLFNIGSPIRPIISFWFLLTCPGMAFVGLLHIKEQLTELTLAVALSLAIDTIVAETMVLTRNWSPTLGILVLMCVSLGGAGLQLIRAHNRRADVDQRTKLERGVDSSRVG